MVLTPCREMLLRAWGRFASPFPLSLFMYGGRKTRKAIRVWILRWLTEYGLSVLVSRHPGHVSGVTDGVSPSEGRKVRLISFSCNIPTARELIIFGKGTVSEKLRVLEARKVS